MPQGASISHTLAAVLTCAAEVAVALLPLAGPPATRLAFVAFGSGTAVDTENDGIPWHRSGMMGSPVTAVE